MPSLIILVIIIVAVIVLVIMLAKTLFKWAFIVFLLILLVYGVSLFFGNISFSGREFRGVNVSNFSVSCGLDEDCSTWIEVNNGCYHECVEGECDSGVLCPVVNKSELERLRNTRCVVNLGCLLGDVKCVNGKCINILPVGE